ncbi:MAG: DNA polymerase III subunit beta [Candidatus Peregrinibacteria bacterium Greene0416_62]|nr:MAG: DNA polymerase III subunit beta [Candidatus Peregrinibacteria bacterium Greene0416_62]TSC98983.1 MAG: DNA polymerase III subunit beta [Candidatus Peregrinibacteria bacterium Greene1014_49]
MKLLCKTTDLQQALHLVSRAISNQQALPILGNILLQAEGKRCIASATDLELSIITNFPAEIENEGSITIPAKAFLNFAQYNTDSEVLLETSEGTQLKCTSKKAKTLISGEAASEYPTITPIEKETTFPITTKPLLEALHTVTFAAASTTLRPVLSGVHVRSDKGKLIFVATDSYRLSEYTIAAGKAGDISCIIPKKVFDELQSVLGSYKDGKDGEVEKDSEKKKKTDATVDVTLSSQQIELQVGATQLLSRLIDGKFPDYQQIIPKSPKTTVKITVKELLPAIRRMHYFAKEINNNLTFHIGKSDMRIVTPSTQAGRDEAVLPITMTGTENKIALSSSYLLDFLSRIPGEEVEIEVTDSQHPALFRVVGMDALLHLIMPLRLQEE